MVLRSAAPTSCESLHSPERIQVGAAASQTKPQGMGSGMGLQLLSDPVMAVQIAIEITVGLRGH